VSNGNLEIQADFLLIGYGNTLRRDDGVGVLAAETFEELALPGVQVLTRHQLVPELAELISRALTVVFIDADPEASGEVQLRPIEPARTSEILAHAPNPGSLLALYRQLFGRCPKAWTLAVPVEDFGFGDGLSPRARAGVEAAVELLTKFIRVSGNRNDPLK